MFAFTKIMQAMSGAAAVVTDAYFNLVTLLLPGNGTNGAQNNTFLDSSTNNFTITRNGNTTQGTFTPFSQTGWSNYFNGTVTTSYLNAVSNAVFAFGTGDFTLEAFIYVPAYPTSGTVAGNIICAHNWNSSGFDFTFRIGQTGLLYFENSAGNSLTGSTAVSLNTWAHVACVRSSGTVTFYINGTSAGSGSATGSISSTTAVSIGNALSGGTYGNFNGYISNARITKGGALYTGTFTPSTTPLTTTVSAGTVSLLTCQSNRFIDNSVNAFALTAGTTTSVQAFSPFAPTAAYSASTVGGSGYFDGTGDYLSTTQSAYATAGDFTVEAWAYSTAQPNYMGIISTRVSSTGYAITYNNSGSLQWSIMGGDFVLADIPKNQWFHVAIVRSGSGTNNVSAYLNGVRVGQTTNTSNTTTSSLVVGRYYPDVDNYYWQGYISGARVVIGSALYSGATYTVPTAPLTAVTNTQLLLNFTNAGITDATAKNDLETVGNAQISTTQSKFGGSSMYFDGTGDYLQLLVGNQNTNLGTGDFTVEFWLYPNSWVANGTVVYKSSNLQIGRYGSNNNLGVVVPAGWLITDATLPSTGTWTHVAVTRSGTSVKVWINGTQSGSTGTSSASLAFEQIGGQGASYEYNGYIDDFRVTKFCRYTTTFTPPTAAFPVQ